MNGFLLMDALRNLLAPELETLPLCNGKKHEGRLISVPAKVHIGCLPAKTGAQPAYDAPFVLVQAMGGYQDGDNFNRMEVALRLCVWHEDDESRENDLHNLISLCRRAVLRQRAVALSGRYVFMASESGQLAPWVRPDEQALYFSEAYIFTHWKMQGTE